MSLAMCSEGVAQHKSLVSAKLCDLQSVVRPVPIHTELAAGKLKDILTSKPD